MKSKLALINLVPGRYGDPLNPWADILAVAEAWCVTSKEAKLALSVPSYVEGDDIIQYNAHRIYGPVMYPFLVTNWEYVWPSRGVYGEFLLITTTLVWGVSIYHDNTCMGCVYIS